MQLYVHAVYTYKFKLVVQSLPDDQGNLVCRFELIMLQVSYPACTLSNYTPYY